MPRQSKKTASKPAKKEKLVDEFELYGFLRGGCPSWFRDVYHHDSLVFYKTEAGARQVKEYGEKIARINVRIEYAGE